MRAQVVELTTEQWQAAVQQGLDELGVTLEQLADMARRRDFASIEARKLWLAIGGGGR